MKQNHRPNADKRKTPNDLSFWMWDRAKLNIPIRNNKIHTNVNSETIIDSKFANPTNDLKTR